MLTTVVLDVGETLVDETPHWQAWADGLGGLPVGDRVDDDVLAAAAAGMTPVHLRRGPEALLQDPPPPGTARTDDLATLPALLRQLRT